MMDRDTVRNMYSSILKIIFEKLVYLDGFIIRIYHDARSSECQIRYGHMDNYLQRVLYKPTITDNVKMWIFAAR